MQAYCTVKGYLKKRLKAQYSFLQYNKDLGELETTGLRHADYF